MAATKNRDIAHIGMVTSAVWADIEGNPDKELVIAGEWMSPRVFSFDGAHFREVKTNLLGMNGWWQSLAVADVNKDGKTDLILGNIGENFFLRPREDSPVKLWLADVDGNGEADKILTRSIEGRDKPVFLKNDLQDQFPGIKKGNLKHQEYANKSIQELFKPEALSKAVIKEFNYPASCVAINNGKGNFTVTKLPLRAQLSSINAVTFLDLNDDGFPDFVSGGNKSGFPPQLQKLDASFGDVFINNGRGGFSWMGPAESGLKVSGEVRDIVTLNTRNKKYLLFLRNNDFPGMYSVKSKALQKPDKAGAD
jgi:hypothetical protein